MSQYDAFQPRPAKSEPGKPVLLLGSVSAIFTVIVGVAIMNLIDIGAAADALVAESITPGAEVKLDIKAATKEIARYDKAMQRCYERVLKNDPEAGGKVELLLVIDAEGQVADASSNSQEFADEHVHECIVRTAKRMNFPPHTGDPVRLKKNYKFEPELSKRG